MGDVLYRRHRGALAESLATACPVDSFAHLVSVIRDDWGGWVDHYEVTPETVRVSYYGIDGRIGWDTYVVTVGGTAIGFTNGPLERASPTARS